jgi:hypothetical protein
MVDHFARRLRHEILILGMFSLDIGQLPRRSFLTVDFLRSFDREVAHHFRLDYLFTHARSKMTLC